MKKVNGRARIGECIFNFVTLDEPEDVFDNGEEKYSVQLLIPKSDEKSVNALQQAIKEAEEEGKKGTFNGKIPKKIKNTLHDGDGENSDGEPYPDSYHGHYFMTCTSKAKFKPGLYVNRGGKIANAEIGEITDGDYGFAVVQFRPYNYNGNKGISSYIQSVLKTRSGNGGFGRNQTSKSEYDGIDLSEYTDTVNIDPITGEPVIDSDFSGYEEDEDVPF